MKAFLLVALLVVAAQATNLAHLRARIEADPAPAAPAAAPAAPAPAAQSAAPAPAAPAAASSSSSASEADKGTVHYAPVSQSVVVGDKDKTYTPLLFNEETKRSFPADGLVKAAIVPRNDGEPIKPLIKKKDGSIADAALQPVAQPPSSVPVNTVFLETERRVAQGQKQQVLMTEAARAVAENMARVAEVERQQDEFEKDKQIKAVLDPEQSHIDEMLNEVEAFTQRTQAEYTGRKIL